MSDIKTTSTLYIPDNIKTNYEFMPEFGWEEMIKAAIVVGIALVIALIWGGITSHEHSFFHGVAIVGIAGFGAFGVFKKDNYNQSMLDHARRFFLFSKEQQKYKYQYYNPFAPKD